MSTPCWRAPPRRPAARSRPPPASSPPCAAPVWSTPPPGASSCASARSPSPSPVATAATGCTSTPTTPAPPSRRGSSVGGSPASRSPTLATPPGPADPISTISPIGRRAVGQHDLRLLLGLTAQVADSHRVPGAERPQRRQEVLHAGDLLAVDRGDHVTGLEPGLGGRTAADHVEHDHAAAGAHPELLGRLRRQVAR